MVQDPCVQVVGGAVAVITFCNKVTGGKVPVVKAVDLAADGAGAAGVAGTYGIMLVYCNACTQFGTVQRPVADVKY